MTRRASPADATGAAAPTVGDEGTGVATIWPGDGGGGGTSGRAIAGVETEGVGREGYGVPLSAISVEVGVRLIPGMLAGVAAATAGDRTGVADRGVSAGFVSGVVAPTVIRRIAPHTLHRARTPFGGTLAGSTRKTERQS
ncbi:MAG: hypothetical protein U5K74_06250 [Gemmatimonadaceae bacterium]|nr:hypothetical protein [Gemmatimonadaceae bacterium]